MTIHSFDVSQVHPSWQPCLSLGLAQVDATYLQQLSQSQDWLPGPKQIFNAFSLPLDNVNYVLFGESPYPRRESANGYAFWDAAVKELWSPSGLSKQVNRATSLRNIIKMLLIANNSLETNHTSQTDIANTPKHQLVQTNRELFTNFLNHGFLLLNATPVLQSGPPQKDARAWLPFIQELLKYLTESRPQVTFILLGKIAQTVNNLIPATCTNRLYAEHPYNISFITNPDVIDFFKPLHLLKENQHN